MKNKDKKIIGIIGGMGPKATALLFNYIIDFTKATCDQEHIHVIIDNNTSIPDRTAAILYSGESPIKELIKSAHLLQNAGADFIIVPCNTSHFFLQKVREETGVVIVDMIEAVVNALVEQKVKKVGLLATTGTIKSGIYHNYLLSRNIDVVVPDDNNQEVVMDFIYECVKKGNYLYDVGSFKNVINDLISNGAETIILGCTELSYGVEKFNLEGTFIDALKILAKRAIKFAGYEIKQGV